MPAWKGVKPVNTLLVSETTGIPVVSETLVNTELPLLRFLGYRYHLYPLSLLRNQLVYRFQIDKLQILAVTEFGDFSGFNPEKYLYN